MVAFLFYEKKKKEKKGIKKENDFGTIESNHIELPFYETCRPWRSPDSYDVGRGDGGGSQLHRCQDCKWTTARLTMHEHVERP